MSEFSEKIRNIYFLRPVNTAVANVVKIGCSKAHHKRIIALHNTSPVPLKLIGTIRGSIDDERRIHGELAQSHSHTEWFHWSPKVRALVTGLLDGSILPSEISGGASRCGRPIDRCGLALFLAERDSA